MMDRKALPSELRGLLKTRIAWPLDMIERTEAQTRVRKIRHMIVLEIVLLLLLLGLFTGVGLMPSLHTVPGVRYDGVGDPQWLVLQMLFWIGLGFAIFCGLLIWALSRRQEPGHPWRFALDAQGMRITTADGIAFGGPWSDWRFVRHGVLRYRLYPVAILWLELACRGSTVVVDLRNAPRPRRLAAAILQNVLPPG